MSLRLTRRFLSSNRSIVSRRSRVTDNSSINVSVIHSSLSVAGSAKYCGFLPFATRARRGRVAAMAVLTGAGFFGRGAEADFALRLLGDGRI